MNGTTYMVDFDPDTGIIEGVLQFSGNVTIPDIKEGLVRLKTDVPIYSLGDYKVDVTVDYEYGDLAVLIPLVKLPEKPAYN